MVSGHAPRRRSAPWSFQVIALVSSALGASTIAQGALGFVCPRASRGCHHPSALQFAHSSGSKQMRLKGWSRRAGEGEPTENKPDIDEAAATPKKEQTEEPTFSLFGDWTWLNPARSFERRRVLESGAEMAQSSALGVTLITLLTKCGMLLRTTLGLSPLEDSIWVENSGRLVPLVSGILLPSAQIVALLLAAIAIATLLSEELQREALRVLNVDIAKQRRLRATTAALLVMCVALQVSPPLPGVDF
mmetsp:Transcript_11850/g.21631  ORF Transcript_11850/g.21631 Transcript_11850/m.21631 type:complete len:247 (-) Transcript_11850:130-870(-)